MVFGFGEVTGTRKSANATDGPSTTSQDGSSSKKRRNSFTPSVESRDSSMRGSAGASGASLGLASVPIPYKKVMDAINTQSGTPSVALGGMMLAGSQQREEYSLSTRQSYLQPGTPSQGGAQYYRSQQSSPAAMNFSANRQPYLMPSASRPHGQQLTSAQLQQLQQQRHLQMYSSAPAAPTHHDQYGSLPPPHFPTSTRHQAAPPAAAAGGQSRSATPADFQMAPMQHQQFDISQQSAYDAEQLLRNSMMMGAAHQQQLAHGTSSAH